MADFFHFIPGYKHYVYQPGREPIFFGIGAALTLDEFALILHLDNVYWTHEGRSSIEATLMGFTFAALCLLATAPLGSDPSKDIPHWVLGGVIVVNMSFALVAFLKGKSKLVAFGVFIPGLAILAAARLAKPSSPWARRFYPDPKLNRSHTRATLQDQRYSHLKHRIYDTI